MEANIVQTISATTAPRFSTPEVTMVGPREKNVPNMRNSRTETNERKSMMGKATNAGAFSCRNLLRVRMNATGNTISKTRRKR